MAAATPLLETRTVSAPRRRPERVTDRRRDLRHHLDATRVQGRLRAVLSRRGASVAMADAAVGESVKTKEFPLKGEACYSKDIQWGTTGVDHTVEREFHTIFCDKAFPPPCAAAPVNIPLKDPSTQLPFERGEQATAHGDPSR